MHLCRAQIKFVGYGYTETLKKLFLMRRLPSFMLALFVCVQIISCTPRPVSVRVCTTAETELTGRGNVNEALTAVNVMAEGQGIIRGIDIVLKGTEAVKAIRVSEGIPYPKGADCRPGACISCPGKSIPVTEGKTEYHLPCHIRVNEKTVVSICADIREDAPEGTRLSAKVVRVNVSGLATAPDLESPGSRQVILARKLLYAPGDYSSRAWRIPAILQLSDGTLLAVNDKRNDTEEDLPGRIDITYSYSTDKGKTWSEPGCIVKNDGFMGGHGDPSLAQLPDGTVMCMMCGGENFSRSCKGNPQRCFFAVSKDCGRTWSEVRELTETLWGCKNSLPQTAGYSSNFFSSGNCLVLKKGEHKGRMLVAGVLGKKGSPGLFNHAIYTDDGGRTWHASEPACYTGDEAKMVELNDGRILMSIRTIGDRLRTVSEDGGRTWSPVQGWPDMHVTNCNGDMVRYNDSLLMHSITYSMARENISILLSGDEGRTWSERKTILEGPGQYSSITVLQDGTVGAYIEKNTWNTELWYLNFSMDWLRNNEASEPLDDKVEGTRLWEGGPEWALCNMGATSPEQAGAFYAWGETGHKVIFGWDKYKFGEKFTVGLYPGPTLSASDDAAAELYGDGWRIPEEKDFEDLCNNCDWTWTKQNGVNGYMVTGRLGSIFLPAAGYRSGNRYRYAGDMGYYWTSTPVSGDATQAREFYFHQHYRHCHDRGRDNGHVIRAVRD